MKEKVACNTFVQYILILTLYIEKKKKSDMGLIELANP